MLSPEFDQLWHNKSISNTNTPENVSITLQLICCENKFIITASVALQLHTCELSLQLHRRQKEKHRKEKIRL